MSSIIEIAIAEWFFNYKNGHLRARNWNISYIIEAFQVVLVVKKPPANAGQKRCGFSLWVRKIPWRRAW